MRKRGLFGQIEILSCGLKLNPSRLDNVVIIRRLLEIFGSAETDTIPLRGGISKDGGEKKRVPDAGGDKGLEAEGDNSQCFTH